MYSNPLLERRFTPKLIGYYVFGLFYRLGLASIRIDRSSVHPKNSMLHLANARFMCIYTIYVPCHALFIRSTRIEYESMD